MPWKATHVYSDSQNPDVPLALVLTDAALIAIDSDDAPILTLTPAALAELPPEQIVLTPLLVKRLAEFKAARLAREQAPKGALLPAIQAEDAAALNLAWAFEIAIEGVQS